MNDKRFLVLLMFLLSMVSILSVTIESIFKPQNDGTLEEYSIVIDCEAYFENVYNFSINGYDKGDAQQLKEDLKTYTNYNTDNVAEQCINNNFGGVKNA